jgi:alpha-galactosidase
MNHEMRCRNISGATSMHGLAGLLLCLSLLAAPAYGQSLAGRWAATGSALANGEAQKDILDLKQDGDKLSGTLQSLGFINDVTGKVTGAHFELWGVGSNDPKPFVIGELVNGELHASQWGDRIVAHKATAADEIPRPAYLEPPALHRVKLNGLAATPPMGWNSWNLFAEKVDDQTVRTMADSMVSSGMRDAGYIYVNIDDTWEGVRDAQGNLQPNHKFPDMKALADYVHSKGLKLGIYSSPGPRTCGSYPASYGHEAQDARMWASWGIDYLKYDWCSAGAIYKDDALQPVYQKMGDALAAAGRPIVYSLCEYGMGSVEKWGADVSGNLWRTTGDIRDAWDSMMSNIEKQVPTAPYAGPGHWNDPDMLEIGNGHMTDDEYRTHMSLWALTASPLLAGNDIRSMSPVTKSILMNSEVIAIDQDPLGKQASPVKNGDLETWIKPLADGGAAVGVVNLGPAAAQATVNTSDLQLARPVAKARDLWSHQEMQLIKDSYTATIPSHGTLLLRVWAQ